MRYLLLDEPGVVDTNTGKPVDHNGKPAVGLEKKYAYELRFRLETDDLVRELRRKHTAF
jgi:hypothetical protein